MQQRMMKITAALLMLLFLLCGCTPQEQNTAGVDIENPPAYAGSAYIELNGNIPAFSASDYTTKAYEHYGTLDRLGRCRACTACLGEELMPTEERGDISEVHPTGWQKISFDFVDGGSLYNRCHLIAHQLADEDANEQNLITGTRYLNVEGMLPFEELTGNYIRETGNHVLYRVTPVFSGNELVARGVQMEGYSVEDKGAGICFNVYCFNVQPGVTIDYRTGKAESDGTYSTTAAIKAKYIINTHSGKFHRPECDGVRTMSEKNKQPSNESRETLIKEGYTPCGECKP